MKQTFKTLALVTLIGGSLTACNSNDSAPAAPVDEVSMDTPAPRDKSIAGVARIVSEDGVTGEANVTATLNNVDLINTAKYLNGAQRINANITYTVDATLDTALDTERTLTTNKKGTVTLNAVEGKNYAFSETIYDEEGNAYQVSGVLDIGSGELRSDIEVINDNFYITNEGTGEKIALNADQMEARTDHVNNYVLKGDKSSNIYHYHNDLIAAQNEGWTGSGISIVSGDRSVEAMDMLEVIAPNSTIEAHTEEVDAALITHDHKRQSISVGISANENDYDLQNYYVSNDPSTGENKETTLVAGGVALVWNKFDTLESHQMNDLVAATADGNRFILADALSPVGNLK